MSDATPILVAVAWADIIAVQAIYILKCLLVMASLAIIVLASTRFIQRRSGWTQRKPK